MTFGSRDKTCSKIKKALVSISSSSGKKRLSKWKKSRSAATTGSPASQSKVSRMQSSWYSSRSKAVIKHVQKHGEVNEKDPEAFVRRWSARKGS